MSSAKYQKALYGNQISLGMHFRMMFETEELGTRSCICSLYDSEITVLALLSYPDGERSTQQDGVILLFDAESPNIASWSVKKNGLVYAIEFSHRSGRDLVNMAKKRSNVIPIIEDARHLARLTKWTLSGEVQELLPPAPLPPQNMGDEPRTTEEP